MRSLEGRESPEDIGFPAGVGWRIFRAERGMENRGRGGQRCRHATSPARRLPGRSPMCFILYRSCLDSYTISETDTFDSLLFDSGSLLDRSQVACGAGSCFSACAMSRLLSVSIVEYASRRGGHGVRALSSDWDRADEPRPALHQCGLSGVYDRR
jgi:hypothetical protein